MAESGKNILLIEPIGMGGALLPEAVKRLGYRSVAATEPEICKAELAAVREFIDNAVYVKFSDEKSALETLVASDARYHYAAVLASWEFLTGTAAELAGKLGLKGPVANKKRARRNKCAMHRAWEKAGCPIPALQAVVPPEQTELAALSARLSFPAVVKPAENSASFGVSVIDKASALESAVAAARQWDCEFPHGIPFDKTVLIQEYIAGQEFSVEAVSDGGRFFAWGVTMKFTTKGGTRAETGHIFPAPIDSVLGDKILAVAERGAAALGITDGISHTEIKLDKNGKLRLIECGSRPAGDYIPKLVALACGESPMDIYVLQAAGALAEDFRPRAPFQAAAVHFIRPESAGVLQELKFPAAIQGADIIERCATVPLGGAVNPGGTNIERIGRVILTAPDARRAHAAVRDFVRRTEVKIV